MGGSGADLRWADGGKAINGLLGFLRYVQRGDFRKEHSRAAYTLARGIAALVREEYRSQSTRPYGFQRASMLQGKDAGLSGPARPGRPATSSLTLLSRSVVVTKLRTGYRIEIDSAASHPDPSSRFPQGVPLKLLAHWLENPTPSIVPVTLRMIGYQRRVRAGQAGPGKRRRPMNMPDRPTGHTIVLNRKRYPVWENVAGKLQGLEPFYTDDLRKRMRRALRTFGAKV